MPDIAIRCENLSKQYRIGEHQRYKALRDLISDTLHTPFRAVARKRHRTATGQMSRITRVSENRHQTAAGTLSPNGRESTFWALDSVSFAINQGEVVGIIGRNGAGKSTLLKILSRITEPTKGSAEIHGRVSSLLEVGTGFHPELTGRENIFLNGRILGMKRAEIERKFDEIVAFAEVEAFLDTPVKHYSSGMYVRLAFAVAAHLEPQILLVDEVLAVGDSAFQKKCLGKMDSAARDGRTILFVSHNMAAIMGLCSRAILLDRGTVVSDGDASSVINSYLRPTQSLDVTSLADRADRQGNGAFRFSGVELLDSEYAPIDSALTGQHIKLALRYTSPARERLQNVTLALSFLDHWEQMVTLCWTEYTGDSFDSLPQEGMIVCDIPKFPLVPGAYALRIAAKVNGVLADHVDNAFSINVIEGDFFGTGKKPKTKGVCLVPHAWSLHR